MGNGYNIFISFLMVSLFYAFAVTLIVPALPNSVQNQVIAYTNDAGIIDYTTLGTEVETTLQNQVNVPLLDFGALVFYSSSFLLNLMINFVTAIPQMLTMFLASIFIFFPVEQGLQIKIKMIFTFILSIFYFLGIIAFITNFRSGGGVG